jgi:anti-sigma factor RsiW
MNREFELKLQAWLDGELTPHQARQAEAEVKDHPEAQALLAELKATVEALRGNEPEYKLAETSDFYWSKIERAIAAQEQTPRPAERFFFLDWLARYGPQLSGALAALLLLAVAGTRLEWFSHRTWIETESVLDEIGTVAFRSETDQMTVVWIYDRSTDTDMSRLQPDEETTDAID